MRKVQLRRLPCLGLLSVVWSAALQAQPSELPLGNGLWVMESFEQDYIRVSVVARELATAILRLDTE